MSLKKLLYLTIFTSLFVVLCEPFFQYFSIPYTPKTILGLSKIGLHHSYVWQLITYPFVEIGIDVSSTFSLFIVFLKLYFLWFLGSFLVMRLGERTFLWFTIATTLITGSLVWLSFLFDSQSHYVSGLTPLLLAMFTLWTFFDTKRQIFIFSIFPIECRYLFAIVIGILFFLSDLSLTTLTYLTTPILIAYLYGLYAHDLESPFTSWHPFERKLKAFFAKKRSKIIHLYAEVPLDDDDTFVEEMLEKVATQGPNSLSLAQKRRLDAIAKKKKR